MILVPIHEYNPNHEPAGSSKGGEKIGGRFAPKHGENWSLHDRPFEKLAQLKKDEPPKQKKSPLATGSVVEQTGMGAGLNEPQLVTLEDGTKAVFKPEVNEQWDIIFVNSDISHAIRNKEFSLAEREAAAYEVDQLLGTKLVPETVLREEIEGTETPSLSSEYDDDELRSMYDDYREGEMDQAYEAAGEYMGERYQSAIDNHQYNLGQRHDEVVDLWNEVIDDHPEYNKTDAYGSLSKQPALPGDFNLKSRHVGSVLDPVALMNDAGVNVEGKFTDAERDNLRALIRKRLDQGYRELGDIDTSAARSDFKTYGEWIESHADTEGRAIDEHVMSFTAWRHAHGYDRGGSGNDEAPHPSGGSLQRFVEGAHAFYSWERDSPADRERQYRLAILDYAIGQMDRHGNNIFRDSKGNVVAIDNGYSFPSKNGVAFRTPAWSSLSGEIPSALQKEVAQNLKSVDWAGWVQTHPAMNEQEATAFLDRIEALKGALTSRTGLSWLWDKQRKF